VRSFVALWPPPHVIEALEALDRPTLAGVRWSIRDEWHITLSFLGDMALKEIGVVGEALVRGAGTVDAPPTVTLGPYTQTMGANLLCVEVAGVDGLARALRSALGAVGHGGADMTFRGHLTLARARRGTPGGLVGVPCAASWVPHEVCLVASTLNPRGPRYETLRRVPLGGGG